MVVPWVSCNTSNFSNEEQVTNVTSHMLGLVLIPHVVELRVVGERFLLFSKFPTIEYEYILLLDIVLTVF